MSVPTFTERLNGVIEKATEDARAGGEFVGTEHCLLAMITSSNIDILAALAWLSGNIDELRQLLTQEIRRFKNPSPVVASSQSIGEEVMTMTPKLILALTQATEFAVKMGSPIVDLQHLFLILCSISSAETIAGTIIQRLFSERTGRRSVDLYEETVKLWEKSSQ